jgi:hypothetical protein
VLHNFGASSYYRKFGPSSLGRNYDTLPSVLEGGMTDSANEVVCNSIPSKETSADQSRYEPHPGLMTELLGGIPADHGNHREKNGIHNREDTPV